RVCSGRPFLATWMIRAWIWISTIPLIMIKPSSWRAWKIEKRGAAGVPLGWIFHSRLRTPTEYLLGRGSRRAILTYGARFGRSLSLPDYGKCGLEAEKG